MVGKKAAFGKASAMLIHFANPRVNLMLLRLIQDGSLDKRGVELGILSPSAILENLI